jgi:hypothetical protein
METAPETAGVGVRRRRRPRARWLILAALVASLVAGLIAATVWWATYQSLASGCCSAKSYDGARSFYGWTLANHGRFDVRVTGIDAADNPGMFTNTSVAMYSLSNDFAGTRVPFQPFTLAPGDQRMVFISGVVSCAKAREGLGFILGQQRVHFTVLGLRRVRWIPFGEVPAKPPPGTCPGAQL